MNTSTEAVAATFEDACMQQDLRIAAKQIDALPTATLHRFSIGPSEMESMTFEAFSLGDAMEQATRAFGSPRLNIYARLGEPTSL